MINAIVETNGGILVIDLPRSIYDLYEKLNSIGIRCGPINILLTDKESEEIRVKLHADSQMEEHLLHVLDEHNSLQDANLLIHLVTNASGKGKVIGCMYLKLQSICYPTFPCIRNGGGTTVTLRAAVWEIVL